MRNEHDLLEEWHDNAMVLSSTLNPKQSISRSWVERIYNSIKEIFPAGYFSTNYLLDQELSNVSWISSLLINKDHLGCLAALQEVAELIEYAKLLDTKFVEEMKNLIKNPVKLRSYFFELYIFYRLDEIGFQNIKKNIIEGKELEGIVRIGEFDYLFECKKLFYPNLTEIDILRRVMTKCYTLIQKYKPNVGHITSIILHKPIQKNSITQIYREIENAIQNLNTVIEKGAYTNSYEFGNINIYSHSIANLIEQKDLIKPDILIDSPPPQFDFLSGQYKIQIKMITHFSEFHDTLYKKFKDALRKKKRQHRNSQIPRKIFFFDSEALPEFQMGLFQMDSMFDIDRIKKIYEEVDTSVILCIVRRNYLINMPKVSVSFIYKTEDQPVIENLQKLFS